MRRWPRACTVTASTVSEVSRAYMDAILALPAFAEWRAAALKEPWVMQGNEPDWPLVRGEVRA